MCKRIYMYGQLWQDDMPMVSQSDATKLGKYAANNQILAITNDLGEFYIRYDLGEFYIRYYVCHKGKFGHKFLEFEFRPRDHSNFNYKKANLGF